MMGFLNINKPPGPTSHDMVYMVRRSVPRGVKVGHAGTLDPFAQGVLVVCLGGACRLVDLVMGQPKRYQAVIRLGAVSDTEDPTGVITPGPADAPPPDETRVRETLARFVGTIQQVPPNHSAIFVEGKRAYKIARSGGELSLPARPVTIHSIDVLSYAWPDLTIDVACGSGTYIRSLARDIGAALGCGGYCQALTRTAVGEFTLASAVSMETLRPNQDVISPLTAVATMPQVRITPDQIPHLLLGRRLIITPDQHVSRAVAQVGPANELAILGPEGGVMAMGYLMADGRVQPSKVIVEVPKKAT